MSNEIDYETARALELKLVSLKQAADYLGVNPDTLRRKVKKGGVKYTRTPGGHYKFTLRDLVAIRQPVNPRAVIYTKHVFVGDRAPELQALAVSHGFIPVTVIHEYENNLAKAFPDRPGARVIARMFFKGEIQYIVTDSPRTIGTGSGVEPWLDFIYRLGLAIFVPDVKEPDKLIQYPLTF